MSATAGGIKVFRAGEESPEEMDFGPHAKVTVWQGRGHPLLQHEFGTGYSTYQGRFNWSVEYNCIYFFLDGNLTIHMQNGTSHTAKEGDILVLPKGLKNLTYESTDGCRIFWVCQPADWEEVSDMTIPRSTQ